MELLSGRPVKQILHRLNISYRIIPLSQGWLYFCTPTQGPTFDLLDGADGSLTDTGEGDLCIYARQPAAGEKHQAENLISGFLALIQNPSLVPETGWKAEDALHTDSKGHRDGLRHPPSD